MEENHDPIDRIRAQALAEKVRVTAHAQEEMTQEDILLDDILAACVSGRILEDYPEHRRGSCCLLYGDTTAGRPLHVVCTATRPTLIIITAYEPRQPKWVTPTRRRGDASDV